MAEILGQAKESQAKTHAMLDNTRYQSIVSLPDNFTDQDIETVWSQMPMSDRVQFNADNGITGISSYRWSRPVIERYRSDALRQQNDAETQALRAARAEVDARNAAPDVYKARNGKEYTITKDFSNYVKDWNVLYNNAVAKAKAAQAIVNDPNATAEARAQAQEALTQAQNDASVLSGQLYAKMGEGDNPLLAASEGDAPTTLAEVIARGRTENDGGAGEDAIAEVLNRALTREDEAYPEPEKKSWEQMFYEREAKRAALDRDNEARRINRERLGRGIGDLAATIGDMVRASEGAPVTQRDWQKYYDALTAQEKANVNNYQIRMAKLNEDIRADRARKDAMALAAAQKAADNQFKLTLEAAKQQGALKKQAASDEEAMKRADVAAKARTDAAQIAADAKKDKSETSIKGKPVRFAVGGKTYDVLGGESFRTMMSNILSVLNNPASTAPGKVYNRISFKPEELQTDGQGFYNRRIIDLLSPENMNNYTPTARTMIENIVKMYLYNSEAGGSFSGPSSSLPHGVDLLKRPN